MSGPVTLPLNCRQCGGAVTLVVSKWTPEVPAQSQTWKCPHCHKENSPELLGKVVWVRRSASDLAGRVLTLVVVRKSRSPQNDAILQYRLVRRNRAGHRLTRVVQNDSLDPLEARAESRANLTP